MGVGPQRLPVKMHATKKPKEIVKIAAIGPTAAHMPTAAKITAALK